MQHAEKKDVVQKQNEDEKDLGPLLNFQNPTFTRLKKTRSEILKEKDSKMCGPNRPPTPHPKCGPFRRYNSSQI